ncbi:uncharacterized protein LOC123268588 [Cotesia glomerata]|nr:uncharacterized protein LOC123268588 [Cotesia glomerata]
MDSNIFLIFLLICVTKLCIVDLQPVRTYKGKLNPNDTQVVDFAKEGFQEFFKGLNNTGPPSPYSLKVQKAEVLRFGEEKRYTILVKYTVKFKEQSYEYYCHLLARTTENSPIFIRCFNSDPTTILSRNAVWAFESRKRMITQQPMKQVYEFYNKTM